MGKYVLALDQGTTSSRAIVFDRTGRLCAMSQKEITQFYPEPGWVEHDPEEIWSTQMEAARQALGMAGAAAEDVAALGIANQRETTVVWNRETGKPIHRAIVWQDRRTADRCDEIRERGLESFIQTTTGLLADPYFSGTKLAWILDNVPNARADADAGLLAFGTIDSFLIWRLTGGRLHVTDATNACRTMLFDLTTMSWSEELLRELRIPESVLPTVVRSSQIIGGAEPSIFGAPIPISGVAGDQQAATFGQACFTPGMVKSTYGTGCFLLAHCGGDLQISNNRLLTTVAASADSVPCYALEGSVFVAGAAIQWLRDELGLIRHASDAEPLASSVRDSGGVYVVPAFTGLGAPHWDPHARGAVLGLSRGTGKAHVVRATLESIAFQCFDVLEAIKRDTGSTLTELRVDGGASANNFLMQFQADLLGIPVVRPTNTETTAAGAAFLAGLSVGFWQSVEEIEQFWERDRVFSPSMPDERRQGLISGWHEAVRRVGHT